MIGSTASTTTLTEPEVMAAKIKEIAKRIREQFLLMKNTVKVIHRSGAIEELTMAVRDVAIATRDMSIEINASARELSDSGRIKDIATTINETASFIMTESAKPDRPQNTSHLSNAAPLMRETKRGLASKDSQLPIAGNVVAVKESESKASQEAEKREQLLNQAQKKIRKKKIDKKTQAR